MLQKYIKNFLCVIMICSFVLPAYASLSASDGSAFVTKGEFDSALADFNSRLTTFEAGINSKIDSQVTTYLDRNGIWSGQKQDILWASNTHKFPMQEVVNVTKATCTWRGAATDTTSYTNAANTIANWTAGGYPYRGFRAYDPSTATSWMAWFNLANANPITPPSGWCNASKLFTSTKSGLCVLDIEQLENDYRYWKIQLSYDSDAWVQDHRCSMDLGYAIVTNALKDDEVTVNPDYEIKNRTSFASRAWTEAEYGAQAPAKTYAYHGSTSGGYNVLDLNIVQIKKFEYFFLAKKDKVYIAMAPIWYLQHVTRVVSWNTNAIIDEYTPITIRCKSAIVY